MTKSDKLASKKGASSTRKPGIASNTVGVAAVEIVMKDQRFQFFGSLGCIKDHATSSCDLV
jgi:hypothetical protein